MAEGIQRKLAAVLAADVAGYSRLMGEDEAATLSALRHLRTELFLPAVDQNNGAVVKSMGDGWLVEFASDCCSGSSTVESAKEVSDSSVWPGANCANN